VHYWTRRKKERNKINEKGGGKEEQTGTKVKSKLADVRICKCSSYGYG